MSVSVPPGTPSAASDETRTGRRPHRTRDADVDVRRAAQWTRVRQRARPEDQARHTRGAGHDDGTERPLPAARAARRSAPAPSDRGPRAGRRGRCAVPRMAHALRTGTVGTGDRHRAGPRGRGAAASGTPASGRRAGRPHRSRPCHGRRLLAPGRRPAGPRRTGHLHLALGDDGRPARRDARGRRRRVLPGGLGDAARRRADREALPGQRPGAGRGVGGRPGRPGGGRRGHRRSRLRSDTRWDHGDGRGGRRRPQHARPRGPT